MVVGLNKRAVGVFPSRREAESALNELRSAGFPMDKVSVVAKDADREDELGGANMSDRVGNKADEGAGIGAATGGTIGGLTGLLVGLGALAIPGIGPVMLAGAAATTIATAVSGGVIGAVAGGLIGALVGLGIPEERARVYSDRVSRGEYLVIVDGNENEIRHAEAVLHHQGIQEWGVYDQSGVADSNVRATGIDTGVAAMPVDYATPTPNPIATSTIGSHRRAVGIFANRREAESALTELRASGYPMDRVSVIAKDVDSKDIAGAEMRDRAGNQADEGAKAGAVTGTALGGLGGLLVGLGTLAIPGVGPVILGGAAATALATTITGAGIGAAAGGLGGALVGLGIPQEQATVYNERVSRGGYLVIVDGTEDEIRRAATVLSHRGIQDWGIYNTPNVDNTRSEYSNTTRTEHPGTATNSEPNVIIVDKRDPKI